MANGMQKAPEADPATATVTWSDSFFGTVEALKQTAVNAPQGVQDMFIGFFNMAIVAGSAMETDPVQQAVTGNI